MTLKSVVAQPGGTAQSPNLMVDDIDTGGLALNAELVAQLALLDPAANPCVSISGLGAGGDHGGGVFVKAAVVAGDNATAAWNVTLFASSNALFRWRRDLQGKPLDVRAAGAKGDGTTNDTAALQAALDCGAYLGCVVQGHPGDTYLVRYAGATYNGYALKFKHGTKLDLNGATIKLDADQWCSVIINEHIAGGGPDHVELYNGTIDGNEANQTRVWSAGAWKRAVGGTLLTYTPTVIMMNLDTPYFEDLTITNAYICAHYIQLATRPYVHGLTISGGWGDGSILATCTDSDIGDVYAANLRHVGEHPAWGSSWGQGIIWNLTRAAIGSVTLVNCQTPGKLQNGSTDVVWDKLFCVAGPLTCLATTATPPDRGVLWGMKFQGTPPAANNKRIKVGSIICDASDVTINDATQSIGAGVYVYCTEELEIGSYTAIRCSRGDFFAGCDIKDWMDLRVLSSPGLRIGKLNSDRCGVSVLAAQDAGGGAPASGVITVDEITILDPQYSYRAGVATGPYLIYTLDGHLVINKVRLNESTTPPLPSHILSSHAFSVGLGCSIQVGEVFQNQPLNAAMFGGFTDANVARMTVGRVRVDGTIGRSEGAPTLTNAATSTVVAAEEITSWDVLSPLIAVQPVNASAMALGTMRTVPNPSPTTGFLLHHAAAGATDVASWKLLGYSSLTALQLIYDWVDLAPVSNPTGLTAAAMVYSPVTHKVLLFGGMNLAGASQSQTWEYDPAANTWTQLVPATTPAARCIFAMAYDVARDRVVMFGGLTVADDLTWEGYYTGGVFNWHSVASAHFPSQRWRHAMAYDVSRSKTVLHGGDNAVTGLETWEWDGADWSQIAIAAPANGAYYGTAMAYDVSLSRCVLTGGWDGAAECDETYEYDGSAWVAKPAITGPVINLCMAYDSNRCLSLWTAGLVGGAPTTQAETRVAGAWGAVNPLPTLREFSAIAYCPDQQQIVLFGGTSTGAGAGGVAETLAYRRG